jgi:hypothetical protein
MPLIFSGDSRANTVSMSPLARILFVIKKYYNFRKGIDPYKTSMGLMKVELISFTVLLTKIEDGSIIHGAICGSPTSFQSLVCYDFRCLFLFLYCSFYSFSFFLIRPFYEGNWEYRIALISNYFPGC